MADPELDEVLDLMADEHTRDILAHTSQQAMSAPELVEACDVSERTVYRRLEQLQSLGLVTENTQIDPDGHHRSVYKTGLEGVHVLLNNGQYEIRIEIEEDTADRFARMWNDIRNE
ncbi:helix-turn-helix domain-containing protein [Halobacteria archaeon AArc-curdl1]|uniref:Helix-turn-helix domain-containing protein n=1 Tax=Natronosalvus hydrolyticus TaxID=2979988 RepID=A0AAP3E6U9_9EURY|nr:helix-turn-helix domain-containing protein [Halobacteria archaeon AArc-curdl1]